MSCMGCVYFKQRNEYMGYCEVEDYAVSVNYMCNEREEEDV